MGNEVAIKHVVLVIGTEDGPMELNVSIEQLKRLRDELDKLFGSERNKYVRLEKPLSVSVTTPPTVPASSPFYYDPDGTTVVRIPNEPYRRWDDGRTN